MIVYIIKSSLYLIVFLLAYWLLFEKDKRFEFRRYYLLFSLVFSLVVPIVNFSIFDNVDYLDKSPLLIINKGVDSMERTGTSIIQKQDKTTSMIWSYTQILMAMYALGTFIMVSRYIRNLWSIYSLFKNSEKLVIDKMELVLASIRSDPFCFGKYIFVSSQQIRTQKLDSAVLEHENVHANGKHTLDVLFVEFLIIFFWFNPLFWVYRFMIKANHEYIADHGVIKTGILKEHYCQVLLSHLSQSRSSLPVSGFGYFLIKNRIIMMNKQKSTPSNFFMKIMSSIIIIVITFFGVTSPAQDNKTIDASEIHESPLNRGSYSGQPIDFIADSDTVYLTLRGDDGKKMNFWSILADGVDPEQFTQVINSEYNDVDPSESYKRFHVAYISVDETNYMRLLAGQIGDIRYAEKLIEFSPVTKTITDEGEIELRPFKPKLVDKEK